MTSDCNARSWLFAPGDSERKMEKATASAADIVIFDLEDAVAETEKPKARAMVAAFLKANVQARAKMWVRINPIQGPHALADLAAVMPAAPVGIMFPKPRGRADAELLDHYLTAFEAAAGSEIGATKVMLLATEMPESMLAIGSYAGVPRIAAMSWGAEDLATALGASDNRGDFGGYGFTYELARSLCLVVINEGFTPSAEEIAAAQEIVDLFAANPGVGTIGHKGAMLDRPYLARAQAVLAQAARK
jgi:citrate lyase subunit beta/citryl-CoA lyase